MPIPSEIEAPASSVESGSQPSSKNRNPNRPIEFQSQQYVPMTAQNAPPQQPTAMSTPWTLGSTDGSYARTLALYQQQQQAAAAVGVDPTAPPNNNTAAPSSTIPNNSNNPMMLNAQQQQQQMSQSINAILQAVANQQSLHQDRLLSQQANTSSVEDVLGASCDVLGFDISELWLRTGPKRHQLTHSHLRATALEDSVRDDLVDVYYGENSGERTHRLSPALCKRAKEANDVVWVTAHYTMHGTQALQCSISNVRTAVAVPICHEASNTNMTVIFFSIRRIVVRPTAVEFIVHMSLAAGGAAINSLAEDGLMDRDHTDGVKKNTSNSNHNAKLSQSEHLQPTSGGGLHNNANSNSMDPQGQQHHPFHTPRVTAHTSITGAPLDLQWRALHNVEYLTDGGNSWIHTAIYQGSPVVVKTLKPECQDVVLAINEMEAELVVHSRLHHESVVELIGAGTTSKGVRFIVLERLDGGTLTQMLGYDTRIRDRRRRFWRRKHWSFADVLNIARSISKAMTYCHEEAIPGSIVMHRDLKPDNIGFALDGTVKILDFGLAKLMESSSVDSDEVYTMSGETGSLRYMAPEVAEGLPYNASADVYSFGVILWELNAGKKPFEGLNRELFYERVVHGGERPPLNRKWPSALTSLITDCWDADMHVRPRFQTICTRLDELLAKEKGGNRNGANGKKKLLPKLTGMIDRHSTWF